MSLRSFDNALSVGSTSDFDGHLRPTSDGRAARFLLSSDEEEAGVDEECEDIVVRLPMWTPPASQRKQRSRSFPHRWNPAGGRLRRAVGQLSATGRLLGRRSVPSATTSWDGRRALEKALLLAAAVPLRASSDANTRTTAVDEETEEEDHGLDSSTEATTCPAETKTGGQQSQSALTRNSEMTSESDDVFVV